LNRKMFIAAAIVAVVFGVGAVSLGTEAEIHIANAQGTNGFLKVDCCPIPDTDTCEPTTWTIC
jgi:hypothetical protein